MSIRVKIVLFFVVLTGLLAALAGDLWLMLDNAGRLTAMQVSHYEADKLANELRRGSDDLTRMARSYVATGDSRYLGYYRHIIAIRDGSEPLPQGYDDMYWDHVSSRHDYRRGSGVGIPLVEQLKALQITAAEFSLLAEAKACSDDLTCLDQRAFAALQEEAAGAARPAPDGREQAMRQVYSPEYHELRAAIMEKVEAFFVDVDVRVSTEMAEREAMQNSYLLFAAFLSSGMILFSLFGNYLFVAHITRPLERMLDWIRRMHEGEYLFAAEHFRRDEFGVLATAFSGMAAKVQSDISDLEFISSTDPLTRIRNRITLDRELHELIYTFDRYGTHCAVLLLDVDHFKQVNDNHGHQAGDQVLVELAAILEDSTRESDIVGRWGGEEFMVICPNTDLQHSLELAELIRKRVASHLFAASLEVTVSLGVGAFVHGCSIEQVIARADAALYRAKGEGRNRVCCADG